MKSRSWQAVGATARKQLIGRRRNHRRHGRRRSINPWPRCARRQVSDGASRALLLARAHRECACSRVLVLVLVVLAGAQIVLRDFFDTGIAWADPLMRSLVLWTGMLGALAAVRDDKHIALDVLQRFLSPKAQRAARIVTLGFTAAVCAVDGVLRLSTAWRSISAESAQAGVVSNVPAWLPEAILPIGFGLMAMRFALRAFASPAHAPRVAARSGRNAT